MRNEGLIPTSPEARRRGSVLVFALMAVTVVSILAMGFLQLSSAVTRRQGASIETKQAFYLAEAGLVEAYAGLTIAKTGNVGTEAEPAVLGNGLVWVEATRNANGLVELESTALYGSGRVTLGMVVEPVGQSLMRLGFFTEEDMQLNPDTLVDSYDSSLGSYDDQVGGPTNYLTIAGSNGDVLLAGGDLIHGDVVLGPTGSLTTLGGPFISGTVSNRGSAESLPPIDLPGYPPQPALVHSSAVPLVLPASESGYDSITVKSDATVIIKGPSTIEVGNVTIEKDGELVLDTSGGPIDFYVTGDVNLKNGSIVSVPNGVPSDVLFMIASDTTKAVFLGANSQFQGFIYAPDGTVKVAADFEVYGGIVAKNLNMAAKGRLHYDLAAWSDRGDALPTLYSWRVVDIPDSVALNLGDPFAALGLDRSNLSIPADAHEDQRLILQYLDGVGSPDSYDGMESAFDWTDVSQVISGSRDGEGFSAPEEDPPPADANVALAESSMNSSDLRDALQDALPVSDDVLIAAIDRDPPMNLSHVEDVLEDYGPATPYPLSDRVLLAAVASKNLDSSTIEDILEDNSPLSSAVLQAAIDRNPPMESSDLNNVLAAQ